MKYGYARVSTDDQDPALQLAALKKAGCKTLFKDEGISGATTKRPALLRCLAALEPGDTLIVWKLDRLGRNLRDLIHMLDDLRERGIKFQSLTEAIDTSTPTGRAMWQIIGVLAELERSLITERTKAGVKAAQSRGVPRVNCLLPGNPVSVHHSWKSGVLQPIMPLDLPVKVRPWELTVYPRSHIRR